jgi:hypothetical protein
MDIVQEKENKLLINGVEIRNNIVFFVKKNSKNSQALREGKKELKFLKRMSETLMRRSKEL